MKKLIISKHGSIRQNIMSGIILLSLLVLVVFAFIISAFVYRSEIASWKDRQVEAATNASHSVVNFLQNASLTLDLVQSLKNDYLASHPEYLKDVLKNNTSFFEILYLDSDARMVAHVYKNQPLVSSQMEAQQSQWFQEGRAGHDYQSDLMTSPNGALYLILSRPINGDHVLTAFLNMDMLKSVVGNVQFGKTGAASLISNSGKIIVHSKREGKQPQQTLQGRPEFKMYLSAPGYFWYGQYISISGQKVAAATVPIPGTNWILITEMDYQETYAASQNTGVVAVACVVMLALIFITFSERSLDRNIFMPVEKLNHGAEVLGKGDLSYRVALTQDNEITRVAHAFNSMAERIQEHESQLARDAQKHQELASELEQLNMELEDRVRERTNDLMREVKEKEQVEQNLRISLERLMLLNQVISSGTSTLQPEKVLGILCEKLAQALSLPHSSFSLIDEACQELTIVAEYRPEDIPSLLHRRISIKGSPGFQKLLNGLSPMVVKNSQLALEEEEIRKIATLCTINTALYVPMIIHDQVIGILSLHDREEHTFSEDEIDLVRSVTTAAGQVYENARLYASLQRELIKRQRTEKELFYQSHHDRLTGLYNRHFFEEEIQRMQNCREVFPVSLVMMDIDRLKIINDTFGHATGDEFIRLAAELFKTAFRKEDIVARIGGDEFAVLLPITSEEEVKRTVDRLLDNLAQQVGNSVMPKLSFSIGQATAYADDRLMEVLKLADRKMYGMKEQKKSGTVTLRK